MKNRLSYIKTVLNKYGFTTELRSEDKEVPFNRLNVSFGKDNKGRERTLIISEDHFSIPPEVGASESEAAVDDQVFLRLFAAFPFLMKEQSVGELSRLLMYYNKSLALPGFGLDEVNKLVFFRYSIISTGIPKKKRSLVAIVGTVMLLMDALGGQIEAVAQGASMVDTLRIAIEMLSGYPKAA